MTTRERRYVKYMGEWIFRCSYVQHIERGENWYITREHYPTGIPLAEELCPRFDTLKAAREYIRRGRGR